MGQMARVKQERQGLRQGQIKEQVHKQKQEQEQEHGQEQGGREDECGALPGGVRAVLFRAYSPLTVTRWLELLRDCGLRSVTRQRALQIFETHCSSCAAKDAPQFARRASVSSASGLRDEPGGTAAARAGGERALKMREFGECMHRIAQHVYDKDSDPCARLNSLHLLPLAAAMSGSRLSQSCAEVRRWCETPEVAAGLDKLLAAYAPPGARLKLDRWQSMLHAKGLFPQHLTLIALQDAFYESLAQIAWEDACCAHRLQGPLFQQALDSVCFCEALCRVVVKASCFRASFGPLDLVRLLDQFFFPRRFLRLYNEYEALRRLRRDGVPATLHARQHEQVGASHALQEHSDKCGAGQPHNFCHQQEKWPDERAKRWGDNQEPEPEPARIDEDTSELECYYESAESEDEQIERLKRRVNRRAPDSPTRWPAPASFKVEVARCNDPGERKAARLAVLDFVRNCGRRVAWVPSRATRELALVRAMKGARTTEEEAILLAKLQPGCREKRSATVVAAAGAAGVVPEGFVPLQEHSALQAKLAALSDALNLGPLAQLDWDGSLEDAESKMRALLPGMMSDDVKVAAEAQGKFEMLDKVVRNHKDYRERERKSKEQWAADNAAANQAALSELQAIFPAEIAKGTAMRDLTGLFSLPPALAKRVFQRKALRLVHMSRDAIARLHIADLSSAFTTQGLDLRELRAVYASLPVAFEPDGDGKKAAWKEALLSQLQDMVRKKEAGQLAPRLQVDPAYTAPPKPPAPADDHVATRLVVAHKPIEMHRRASTSVISVEEYEPAQRSPCSASPATPTPSMSVSPLQTPAPTPLPTPLPTPTASSDFPASYVHAAAAQQHGSAMDELRSVLKRRTQLQGAEPDADLSPGPVANKPPDTRAPLPGQHGSPKAAEQLIRRAEAHGKPLVTPLDELKQVLARRTSAASLREGPAAPLDDARLASPPGAPAASQGSPMSARRNSEPTLGHPQLQPHTQKRLQTQTQRQAQTCREKTCSIEHEYEGQEVEESKLDSPASKAKVATPRGGQGQNQQHKSGAGGLLEELSAVLRARRASVD